MRRVVGLTSDELETRERVFNSLTTRAIRRALRTLTADVDVLVTASVTLSAEPPPPNPTIPAGALGVVTTTWHQDVDETLFPFLVQTFVDAAEQTYDALQPAGIELPKITYDLAATYLASAKNRLASVGDVVWSNMRAQLVIGYEAGESIQQLATRLRDVAKISEPRATTIARTEVVPAANFGSLQQLRAGGFTDAECKKEWLATNDARTREAHRLADGQRVGLSQPFKVDGDYLQVPGDPAGRYENVVNCRCSIAYVFDDDEKDDVVTAAGFKKDQRRDDRGRWSEVSGVTLAKHYYAGAGFRNLNQALERGKPLSSVPSRYVTVKTKKDPFMGVEFTAERAVKQLDRAIAGTQLDTETTLFRGTEAKSPPKVGDVVASDAYTSTSRDRKRGLSFAGHNGTLWEITAPVGTHALDIDEGPNTHEREVLLARKTRLRVTGVAKKDGVNVVSAVVEPALLVADARFEALHPRADDGRFGTKSPFTILPKELRGKSGDGMYAPGMWGKYGAAGVMMRHVDERGTPRYLLVQRANPGGNQWKWQLPGGALEQNETPAQGAAREAFEEIGASPELLANLTPRGEHAILRPVEGKKPWRYTNVVADSPTRFTPRVDRSEGELWKAVWLTEAQIREMMTRGRLVAPLAAEFDNIIAKYDEPLVAGFSVITMTVGSSDVTDRDYYDLVTASKWTAADEAKHKRDSEGKFTEKLGVPLHINTKVIYTTKYADGAVVAEKTLDNGIKMRLTWDSGEKKFVLLGYNEKTQGWFHSETFTKKDAYAKFSKETGWFAPAKTATAPQAATDSKKLSFDDVKKAKAAQAAFNVPKAGSSVAPSQTKTLLAQSPGAATQLGKPIHLNTTAIYKTKYDDGVVIAERVLPDGTKERLRWSAGQKKFLLQRPASGSASAHWITIDTYNKGETYKKFSKQTGWTQPTPSAAPAGTPTVGIIKKSIDYMDESELLDWLDANADLLTDVGVTPTLEKTLQKHPAAAAKYAQITALKVGDVDTLDKFVKLSKNKKVAWLISLTEKDLAKFTPDDVEMLGEWNNQLYGNGDLSTVEHTHIAGVIAVEQASSGIAVPDFISDSTNDILAFYDGLTQDDFDKLSVSDQVLIANEAPFFDALTTSGQSYSKKIKNFVAGKGDAGDVNPALEGALLMITQSEYDALSKDEKIKLYEDVQKLPDPTGALEKKLTELIKTHVETHSPTALSKTSATPAQITADFDAVGSDNMSLVKYNGVGILYAKSADDGSGAFFYTINDDGSKGKYVGSIDFGSEDLSEVVNSLVDDGIIDVSGVAAAKRAATPPGPPVSTLAPDASSWHVDVHESIIPVGAIGVPTPDGGNYATLSPGSADVVQKNMLFGAGKTWQKKQIDAIKRYGTSVGYRSTNAVLRDDKKQQKLLSDAQLKDGVKNAVNLQNAMTPLSQNVMLFRGTGAHAFGQNTVAADFTKLKALEGKTLTDKGFMSTTVDETKGVSYDYAKKPIQMIIRAPAGTPAVYADAAIPGHGEHEFILGAGTSYRVDEVRVATAADRAKFGPGTEHVVVATVVPSTSNVTKPIDAPATPTPVVAPSVLTLVTPSVPTAPTLGPIQASDLKKPMKLTTKTIHTTKYQHGAVIAYRKDVDGLARLVWDGNVKKFILQKQNPDEGKWANFAGYTKKDAYAELAKGIAPWYEPPAGDSAIGSGWILDAGPKISTSAPAPSTNVTAPVAPAKKQEKFDVATLQAQHGQIPPDINAAVQRELFDKFKKHSSAGFVTLSSSPETLFTALHETLENYNPQATNGTSVPKLNLLQLLKIVDEQSTNKANAIAKQKDANAPEIANTNAYEKAIVAWLQTPAGAQAATDLLHPPPPTTVNGHVYQSKFTQKVLDTLAKIKPANQIGTPKSFTTSFNTLTQSEAFKLQQQQLAGNPWTSAQQAAIKKYSGNYYSTMNPIIRDDVKATKGTGESTHLEAARTAINIQEGMRPLPHGVRVFRKTRPSQFPGLTDNAKFADIKKFEGKLFVDRAPMSTSISQSTWSGNVHLTIDLPEGTPAIYIENISQNKSELEMLLALGLKYRVISVVDSGFNNVIKVHLRVEA